MACSLSWTENTFRYFSVHVPQADVHVCTTQIPHNSDSRRTRTFHCLPAVFPFFPVFSVFSLFSLFLWAIKRLRQTNSKPNCASCEFLLLFAANVRARTRTGCKEHISVFSRVCVSVCVCMSVCNLKCFEACFAFSCRVQHCVCAISIMSHNFHPATGSTYGQLICSSICILYASKLSGCSVALSLLCNVAYEQCATA